MKTQQPLCFIII